MAKMKSFGCDPVSLIVACARLNEYIMEIERHSGALIRTRPFKLLMRSVEQEA